MLTLQKLAGPVAAIALSLGIGSAQAVPVNFTLTGDVIYADAGNLFGLASGGTVSVVGTFDDSVLTGGTGTVLFDKDNLGNTFTVTAGSFDFTQMDDINYCDTCSGFPWLSLNAGSFDDFVFNANIGTDGFFDSQLGYFDGDDGNFGTISGTWTSFEMTAVPVPAAVWLLGSGLLGLVGATRRKTSI